jgi:glycosyltransferase involved in cell wall biosynthesis
MIGDWAHPPALALVAARLAIGAPVALWVDTPQEHLHRPIYKRVPRAALLRTLLARVDAIFGSGEPARRVLIEMGANPDAIIDLQFLVDLTRPARAASDPAQAARAELLRRSVGCEPGCVFLMAGTLDLEKKGQDLGLRAFAIARREVEVPIGLLIAGAGSGEPALKQLARRLGVERSVRFLGWQEPDEMEAVYLACDALVHPAHYDPFPLVVIEAMSFGRPVIGSDRCGSVEERVRDGLNGYAFRAGHVSELVEALKRLSNDPEHLTSLKREARETAETWPMERGVAIVRKALEALV